jgi:hypothetical protein
MNFCNSGAVHPESNCSASANTQLYGGGARVNFLTSTRVVPYGVVAFGGDRLAAGGQSTNGYYMGFGGGASCYIGHNWGVRPEYRFDRIEFGSGIGSSNASVITGAVFYQFGGQGKVKK